MSRGNPDAVNSNIQVMVADTRGGQSTEVMADGATNGNNAANDEATGEKEPAIGIGVSNLTPPEEGYFF